MYPVGQISAILQGSAKLPNADSLVEHLLTDSRRLVFATTTLFFAIKTGRNDGARYIDELYQRGVRNFVVHHGTVVDYPDANVLYVDNTLRSLQALAAWHRQQFNIPVIAITGSNGKTIVKEWLHQLLQPNFHIVRSPKSYNSQVGVPLSVWQINASHTLAIFEAGISQPGEMEHLQQIIRPTMGVLTNIGEAHSQGFVDTAQKVREKLLLFKEISQFVFCKDCNEQLGANLVDPDKLSANDLTVFSWGTLAAADLMIQQTNTQDGSTTIKAIITKKNRPVQITIPFIDKASIDNAITCWCVLLLMNFDQQTIEAKMRALQPLEMRMQLKKGVNNCLLINDTYNNDLSSLELALDHLSQQSGNKNTTLILSDIYQSGHPVDELVRIVKTKVRNRRVNCLILIGPVFYDNRQSFSASGEMPVEFEVEFYTSTDTFLQQATHQQFKDEVILLKGSRVFAFERIVRWLEEKVHQTVMEVNLAAMVHNLKAYQQMLSPRTKIMAMVKAFSYGSGSAEVAAVLQFHKVDYLTVAYADEGVELRKAGIHMPIMVMNPEPLTFDALVDNNLEPEIYSPGIMRAFNQYLANLAIPQYPVHIKLDTGMHRLGFDANMMDDLLAFLSAENHLAIQSVFSHLAGSDEQDLDAFTNQQAVIFEEACRKIENKTGYSFLKHLSNSAAIFRHPKLQYDMVRLGIGLYGVDTTGQTSAQLQTVATLKSTIAQVRHVPAGESIGYSRKAVLPADAMIATIRIGYADGFARALGNGRGKVFIKGTLAPVVGNVCMDMTMVDVTGIPGLREGDDVEIFGPNLPVEEMAGWANTIPYEILTGISQRVKRVYYEE